MFPARFLRALLCALAPLIVAAPIHAEDAGTVLDLSQAQALAVSHQPLLEALNAQARAEREMALASEQLPDPQLMAGVQDLPASGDDAGSFRRDSDTQIQVGLSQEFPRAAKRHLRGELGRHEAARLDREHQAMERSIRREAALAWLALWRDQHALQLTRASLHEAEAQAQALQIALMTGGTSQAGLLAARMEAGRLRDALADAEQRMEHARNQLWRWIGAAALRPVSPELPPAPPLPPLTEVLERVRQHPLLHALRVERAAADTGARLARADYAPDWRLQLGYANRPEFSEMVSLQVGIDLPVFTGKRQDRGVAAALARGEAAESAVQDALRQLESEARLNYHDRLRLEQRLDSYAAELLPDSESRIQAALAGWGAGRNALGEVLDARRAALEVQTARLELQYDAARHQVQLAYLGAYDGAGESHHE